MLGRHIVINRRRTNAVTFAPPYPARLSVFLSGVISPPYSTYVAQHPPASCRCSVLITQCTGRTSPLFLLHPLPSPFSPAYCVPISLLRRLVEQPSATGPATCSPTTGRERRPGTRTAIETPSKIGYQHQHPSPGEIPPKLDFYKNALGIVVLGPHVLPIFSPRARSRCPQDSVKSASPRFQE